MFKLLEDTALESISGGGGSVITVNQFDQIVQDLNQSNASDKALGAFNTGTSANPGIYVLNPFTGTTTFNDSGQSYNTFFDPSAGNVKASPGARTANQQGLATVVRS